jgi:hypothetical protein
MPVADAQGAKIEPRNRVDLKAARLRGQATFWKVARVLAGAAAFKAAAGIGLRARRDRNRCLPFFAL